MTCSLTGQSLVRYWTIFLRTGPQFFFMPQFFSILKKISHIYNEAQKFNANKQVIQLLQNSHSRNSVTLILEKDSIVKFSLLLRIKPTTWDVNLLTDVQFQVVAFINRLQGISHKNCNSAVLNPAGIYLRKTEDSLMSACSFWWTICISSAWLSCTFWSKMYTHTNKQKNKQSLWIVNIFCPACAAAFIYHTSNSKQYYLEQSCNEKNDPSR